MAVNRYACFAALAVGLGAVLAAEASQTIYVNATTGSDSWTGLCPTHTSGACGPKRTIQAGINVAGDGDLVLVAAGNYAGTGNRGLSFGTRAITVRGQNGPTQCIIDGTGISEQELITFGDTASADAVLDGFTLANTALC
jgi:hypothetical protein